MREIIMAFICFVGLGILGFWTLAIVALVRSGKGLLSVFNRPRPRQWQSIADTIAQYSDDHSPVS
jgi:hypothetical protein